MPKRASKDKMTRLNLALSEPVKQRIESIRDETGAESVTEVIRRAVAVYDLLITETAAGGKVVIKKRGKEKEVLLVP